MSHLDNELTGAAQTVTMAGTDADAAGGWTGEWDDISK